MYCFIYVLWFVFPVVIIQTRRHWIIFKKDFEQFEQQGK
jgi:hypothetical protein